MSDIAIQKVSKAEDRQLPIFKKMDELLDRIRARSYDLFAERGFRDGVALDDWLTAERELCWPATELVETESGYELSVALAGYQPSAVQVTATPREVIVQAKAATDRKDKTKQAEVTVRWSEFKSSDTYRRIEFDQDIDPNKVTATLHDGLLKIIAPKAAGRTATGAGGRVERRLRSSLLAHYEAETTE
jgi:HSP20 family molecular chaperone IbpA